jgi:hypothetical protein
MSRACSTKGKNGNAYGIFVGNPEGKRPLGRPRRRWVEINMDFREREDGMVWTGSIWLKLGTSGGSYEHGNEPLDSIKRWEVLVAAQLAAS